MKQPGQIAVLSFPQTDLIQGKRRPVLLLAQPPGPHDDWWVCMLSTQLDQAVPDFDEILRPGDSDFATTGLRQESVIRVARVAVVASRQLIGAIGAISAERLTRIRDKLVDWLKAAA
ncbi:MAG: type II toxin-antitoxin system PemK/MazF family toxin [Verrucomicrobia bacterium]|nr:type II toxin-antitoxin system PemK/MazF family toxin [Verrucomicrobiota bacterium]